MKTLKNTFGLLMALFVLSFTVVSCQEDVLDYNFADEEIPEGYQGVTFKVNQAAMPTHAVRAVDPDGKHIHNMKVFCFNSYGLFITMVYADLLSTDASGENGTYKAVIPAGTEIVHFVANQNIGQYPISEFNGKSEADVLSAMEGGSGILVYWGRVVRGDADADIGVTLRNLSTGGDGVELLRNQAKVTVEVDPSAVGAFTLQGFRTANIHAFGTVAPYHSEKGFEFDTHDFITLPGNVTSMSDIVEVNTATEDYIFEHENSMDNPVSVIIKGQNAGEAAKYYRVMLVGGANKEFLPILRNHHYRLVIQGPLSYGQDTFEAALSAPATNNVWVAVADWVNEIAEGTRYLKVEKTRVVYGEDVVGTLGESEVLHFEASEEPEISWIDGNNVASQVFTTTYDPATRKGTITITLLPLGNESYRQGKLILTMGNMFRTISVNTVKKMKFTPSWISAQVYGGTTGEHVTLKFTVPEDCPQDLFPFNVLVSVNDLDVRSESGMKLPVRLKGEDGYFGEDHGNLGYKYEYTVEHAGVHRLYFETIQGKTEGDVEDVYLDGEFFETLNKKVTFSSFNKAIRLTGDNVYTFNSTGSGYEADKSIYYIMVPQKRGALVDFTIGLREIGSNGTESAVDAGVADEFFLYNKSLDPNGGKADCNVNFHSIDESIWQTATNGRMVAFVPKSSAGTGNYKVCMKTNVARSEDVIRVASNHEGLESVLNPSGTYAAGEYRDLIFELANYAPFRFNAKVNGVGSSTTGNVAETRETINLDYTKPGSNVVNLSFDVKAFTATVGGQTHTVDPFGESFEIYIDAPMLSLAPNLGEYAGKIKAHPSIPGRFVYTVAATQAEEDTYGTGGTKTIPFVTKDVCSSGEITFSTNEQQIVYFQKTFVVKNNDIVGSLVYNDGGTYKNVPAYSFVSFSRVKTGARIGAVTVTADGTYHLQLRSEYVINWDDEIEFNCTIDGKTYDSVYLDGGVLRELRLSELLTQPNVTLTLAVE